MLIRKHFCTEGISDFSHDKVFLFQYSTSLCLTIQRNFKLNKHFFSYSKLYGDTRERNVEINLYLRSQCFDFLAFIHLCSLLEYHTPSYLFTHTCIIAFTIAERLKINSLSLTVFTVVLVLWALMHNGSLFVHCSFGAHSFSMRLQNLYFEICSIDWQVIEFYKNWKT